MTNKRRRPNIAMAAVCTLLLTAVAQAQTPGIHRCGNSYSESPCPSGQAVVADDGRTDAQRQQALTVKKREARLADQLADERRARENAAQGQGAARIGPSEAQRAHAEALAAKKQAQLTAKKKKSSKPGKLGSA